MTTMDAVSTLTVMVCGGCGVTFAMPQRLRDKRLNDHKNFYCPNGCCRHFVGETREESLEKQLRNANSRNAHLADQLDSAKRSRDAYKGHLNRTKKRVKNGVCPCCNRTFQDLARHMETKHPRFNEEGDA